MLPTMALQNEILHDEIMTPKKLDGEKNNVTIIRFIVHEQIVSYFLALFGAKGAKTKVLDNLKCKIVQFDDSKRDVNFYRVASHVWPGWVYQS